MSTLAELQKRMLDSPLYLASKNLQYAWRRKDNGHIVCVIEEGKRGKVAVLSAVGRVSDSQANVDGVGGWRPAFNDSIEKSKFSFLLERAEGTNYAKDWDRQLDSVNRIQSSICDNTKSRHFLLEDPSGTLLRFTKPIFEKKREGEPVLVNPRYWTVPEVCEDAFEAACKHYHIRPMQVFDENNAPIAGDDVRDAIVGSLVEVNFVLKHYSLKIPQSSPVQTYDCFSSTVVSITLLQRGTAEELCDFVTAGDMREMTKEDTDAAEILMTLKASTVRGGAAPGSVDSEVPKEDGTPGAPTALASGEPPMKRVKVNAPQDSPVQGLDAEGCYPGALEGVVDQDSHGFDNGGFEIIGGAEEIIV